MSLSPSGTEAQLKGIPNPFEDAAVGSVWDPANVDVPAIHSDIFEEVLRTIDERAGGIHHRAILLHGDAGSGKTHVLRRLRLAMEARTDPVIPFSWIWMQTSPSMMWRYVRRQLTDDLVRMPRSDRPQLDRLLATRRDKVEQIAHRDLSVVLEHLCEGHHKRDARAWLAGAYLPDSALEKLGLASRDLDDEAVEDTSRQFVESLAEFISPAPLVLCLDQLEALQSYPGDKNGLFAIGKLIAALYNIPNAVVVCCVQTGIWGDMERAVSKADLDRMAPKALQPLGPNEVRALLQARLATQPAIASRRPPRASEFWPIDIDRFSAILASPEGLTARKALFECERMFRQAQRAPFVERSLDEHLASKLEDRRRRAEKELTADTSSNVLSDGLPRLLHLRGIQVLRPAPSSRSNHISVDPNGKETSVVLANEDPRRLWRKLDRVAVEWNPGLQGLVVLRDALNPLPETARASHERLDQLRGRGARTLIPSREALLAIDAIRRLLADSESGDLTYQGDRVPIRSVEEWVLKNLPEPVVELLDGIVIGNKRSDDLEIRLAAYLDREKVARLADIALALETTAERVESCARQNHHQFGILQGSEPAVFERFPAAFGA